MAEATGAACPSTTVGVVKIIDPLATVAVNAAFAVESATNAFLS